MIATTCAGLRYFLASLAIFSLYAHLYFTKYRTTALLLIGFTLVPVTLDSEFIGTIFWFIKGKTPTRLIGLTTTVLLTSLMFMKLQPGFLREKASRVQALA